MNVHEFFSVKEQDTNETCYICQLTVSCGSHQKVKAMEKPDEKYNFQPKYSSIDYTQHNKLEAFTQMSFQHVA